MELSVVPAERVARRSVVAELLRRFYPVELVVIAFALVAVLLYGALDIPLRVPGFLYVRKVGFAFLTYAFGLLLMLFFRRLRDIRVAMERGVSRTWGESWRAYRASYLDGERVIRDIRCMHALGLMFVVYINLKHLIPFMNAALYDEQLSAFETWLFGTSPTTYMIALFGDAAAPWLSEGYMLFYPYIALLTVAIVLQRESFVVQRGVLGFSLLWCLAILIEYAFPTWGPCFSQPELIASLSTETTVFELQQELWRQREFVLRHPQSPWGVFLISGLPSLHFAVVLQGTFYLAAISPLLARLSALFCLVTGVTTLYFGWHFVSDLLAAALLVYAVEKISRHVMVRWTSK